MSNNNNENNTSMVLKIKKLSKNARLPFKATNLSAGYDLYSAHDNKIPAKGRGIVDTDISIEFPIGCYGRIAPRSSLALKHGIDVGAGVIDGDYKGHVKVILFNFGDEDFEIKKGDRIAQLILEKYLSVPVIEVEELEETERGAGGFGSTGTN
eukprot:TRINITY_DN15533_c0_g1_i1.p1 TRINITY_DN15533_c0_g1~~TRINITY_DN15533_c0_g1_i1.p1  ORF type:complete len:153 (-),score=49.87 TRINITY_DN15533_c0_g1_i1:56-514(-)